MCSLMNWVKFRFPKVFLSLFEDLSNDIISFLQVIELTVDRMDLNESAGAEGGL